VAHADCRLLGYEEEEELVGMAAEVEESKDDNYRSDWRSTHPIYDPPILNYFQLASRFNIPSSGTGI